MPDDQYESVEEGGRGGVVRRVGAVVAAVLLLAGTAAPAAGAERPVVEAPGGQLRGVARAGAEVFRGVPFAASPVGELRWRAPRPAAAWDGVREAAEPGAVCAQLALGEGPRSDSEDCLTLDVARPAGATAGGKLPVLVFLHGGGLTSGSGSQYDGTLLAREQGMVVVTPNYRLGAFGFLGLPALSQEADGAGNFGFLDQQAALRWVRDSIAAFGGDPARVTIAGESAGGFSVCSHLASPGSRGLFRAAVIQSGGCMSRSVTEANATGVRLATLLGCRASDLACLRGRPAAAVLAMNVLDGAAVTRGTPAMPLDPREAVRRGAIARVPVMIGANADEGRQVTAVLAGMNRFAATAAMLAFTGSVSTTREVMDAYGWEDGEFAAPYFFSAVFTDAGAFLGVGGCATSGLAADLARSGPVHLYEFAHRAGPGPGGMPAGYLGGATHVAELPYLFPGYGRDIGWPDAFGEPERALSGEMVRRWGGFVRDGDPGWPAGTGQVLQLRGGGTSAVLGGDEYAAEHRCALWQRHDFPGAFWTRIVREFLGVSAP